MKKKLFAALMAGTLVFSMNAANAFAVPSRGEPVYIIVDKDVVIDESVSVEGHSGASVMTRTKDASFTVNGDFNVIANDDVQGGVMVSNYTENRAEASINGDLTVEGTKPGRTTVGATVASENGGEAFLDVAGDIVVKNSVSGTNMGVAVSADEDSSAGLRVGGDISAPGTEGITLVVMSYDGGKPDVFVEGTVKGGNSATISFLGDPDNFNINAWAIESDADGDLVKDTNQTTQEIVVTEASQKIEKNINYILKVAPEQSENISLGVKKTTLTGAGGKTYEYYTAKEGEEVSFTITAPKGFSVDKAYYKNGVTITPNADGTYTFKVPKGGGVLIGADFILITTGPVYIYNPNQIMGTKASFASDAKVCVSMEEQGEAAKAAFKNALPAGWEQMYSFDIFTDGKADHSRKNGTFGFDVPAQYQKAGRQYAIMGIDKDGKVNLFKNNSTVSGRVESDIDIEGYAFVLIAKD
ncbi:MAG: hypothetical protein K5796_01010 [Lachnospiraceae bacterium]|nr:hypothetical protein [Lachnospiraceae bacterium]